MRTTAIASVSIRFKGDLFDPADITKFLSAPPTLSYRKGEFYKPPGSERQARGLTNLWLLDLSKEVPVPTIDRQIDACSGILRVDQATAGREFSLTALPEFIEAFDINFDVSVFYFASINDKTTEIDLRPLDRSVRRLGGRLRIDIDRETEADLQRNKRLSA